MNHKDERIRKLWESGIKDLEIISRKIGYGEFNVAGVIRVKEALERLKIKE